jgi:hypothetical protein
VKSFLKVKYNGNLNNYMIKLIGLAKTTPLSFTNHLIGLANRGSFFSSSFAFIVMSYLVIKMLFSFLALIFIMT